jgi:hypothetical protein
MNGKPSTWTAERRARQAMLIRTWQPWKKSTGPRTPEGKSKSSRNAYKMNPIRRALLALAAEVRQAKRRSNKTTAPAKRR